MKFVIIITFVTLLIVTSCSIRPRYNKDDITFRGCYEGTQNQAVFFLFDKKQTFLIHWTGVFYSEAFRGSFTQLGDTLFLKFKDNKIPGGLTEKLFMDNQNHILVPVREKSDSSTFNRYFYYGYCKGLN